MAAPAVTPPGARHSCEFKYRVMLSQRAITFLQILGGLKSGGLMSGGLKSGGIMSGGLKSAHHMYQWITDI